MDETPDIEGPPEPEALPEPSDGIPWGGIFVTIGVILLVLFAVQNTEEVSVEFLWMSGQFPLALVILVTALIAGLFAVVIGALYRGRRRKRKAEQAELRQLRGDS